MSSPVQESACDTSDIDTHNNEPETDSDENVAKKQPKFALKMLNLCKEITIMAIIAVAYATLINETPPKVSKSPAAYPFFSRDSLVTDWYRGQITEAIEEARSSDIAFVMFYAPWDAESQTARKELEVAAKIMHKEVFFAAVNCWQPGSECRRQYSKVYKWPVLIAYPTHGRGIQYNGPLEAGHMTRFLQNVCRPVVRPESMEELMGKHDVVVVAEINVLPGSHEYAVFYSAALRALERDPFRDVVFAIVTQKMGKEPRFLMHTWNGTIEYTGELSTDVLSSWVTRNSYQISSWVTPTGMKSLNLASFLQPGPTLILFTPKNPLLQEIDFFHMLREVAYDYHNCANNTYLKLRKKLVTERRLQNLKTYQNLKEKCKKPVKGVVTTVPNVWTNSSITDVCHCGCLVTEASQQEGCGSFRLAENYGPPLFASPDVEGGVNVTGLVCRTNSSLKFVAVDSVRFNFFAERLGIELTKSNKRSALVIIDEKMETHHVMTAPLNSRNVRSFVYNYTVKNLPRSLRSKVNVKVKNEHVYPHLNCSKTSHFCLKELTSEDFLHTVLQKNKVVIVFYYSKQCSFCNGVAYKFLTAAKLLASEEIIFARIDGETNLLPWEYTMESYPTILFFPPIRKSESRAFPKTIPITVPNLVGFVVANVDSVLKLKTMWSLCCHVRFSDEKEKCVRSVRMETLAITGQTLREWRNSTRKAKVLYKLQLLRHLHLMFAHSPEKVVEIGSFLSKLID